MDSQSGKYINSLIAGKILGILNTDEEKKFAQWLAESRENQALYERLLLIDRDERERYIANLQLEDRWTCFRKSVSKRVQMEKFVRFGMIASVLIFIATGWFLFTNRDQLGVAEFVPISCPTPGCSKATLITGDGQYYLLQDTSLQINIGTSTYLVSDGKQVSYSGDIRAAEDSVEMNTIVVPRGGEYEIVLSDRTKIYLNADSKLRYPISFNEDKRVVELIGEAYFKVSKDEDRPFIVRIDKQLDIEVLGTEFNVTAYPNESVIATTLNEGSIKLVTGTQQEYLKPNQQILFDKDDNTMKKCQVEAWIYSAWTEGRIVLRNVSLVDLMKKLSRWYDLNVIWENEQIKKYHFSGEILRYDNFLEILSMLEKATFVKFDVIGNQIIVQRR